MDDTSRLGWITALAEVQMAATLNWTHKHGTIVGEYEHRMKDPDGNDMVGIVGVVAHDELNSAETNTLNFEFTISNGCGDTVWYTHSIGQDRVRCMGRTPKVNYSSLTNMVQVRALTAMLLHINCSLKFEFL